MTTIRRIEQRIGTGKSGSEVTIKNERNQAAVVYKNKVKEYGDTMRNSGYIFKQNFTKE